MSGHSKWSTIKHKKAATDAKKGKAFSEVSKMITIAVREGASGDANTNPRLRLALEKAREVNMPKDNVKRAIEKGLGKGSGASYEEVVYEGFGPGGVGMLILVSTDNRNRTSAEVKSKLDKSGGSLGGPGAVSYMFERKGKDYEVKIPMPVDEKVKGKVEELVEELENLEDVVKVFSNIS